MKTCRFEQMAVLYPTGTLSDGEKTRFEAHLSSCQICQKTANEAKEVRASAVAIWDREPIFGLESRILASVGARQRKIANSSQWDFALRWERRLAPMALAASMALFAVVFLTSPNRQAIMQTGGDQASRQIEAAAPSEYFVVGSLNKSEQIYLADDDDAALSNYYASLSGSGRD